MAAPGGAAIMQPVESPSVAPAPARRGGRLLLAFLFVCTLALFWPAIAWVAGAAQAHGQLLHTLAVAVFLFAAAWRRDPEGPPSGGGGLEAEGTFRRLLAAFGLVGAAMLLRQPLLVFVAAGFAAAGWLRVATRRARLSDATGAVVAFLFAAALAVGRMDWPLRILAGQISLETLRAMGFASDLALRAGGGMPPAILLGVEGRLYEVAAECNGFGLVTGSVVTTVFLSVYWRMGVLRTILLPPLALACAVAFNAARITGICIAAPQFPGHYNEAHEVIGVAAFWSGLFAVYKLCRLLRPRGKNSGLGEQAAGCK